MAHKGPASVDRDIEMMTRTGKMNSDNTLGRSRLALTLRLAAAATALFVALSFGLPSSAGAASRIKDIVDFEGIRENQLVGYGLVVGLDKTGDKLLNNHFTMESLRSMLNRLGVQTNDAILKSTNVAAVMVTANMPAFARQGSRIDVTVSSLGDAKNLLGGTLLVTPMLGADGEVYAVAQGQLAVGGFTAQGNAETVTKGVPTSGRIANGAIVEREVAFEIGDMDVVKLSLRPSTPSWAPPRPVRPIPRPCSCTFPIPTATTWSTF